jgi:hypothetical protein
MDAPPHRSRRGGNYRPSGSGPGSLASGSPPRPLFERQWTRPPSLAPGGHAVTRVTLSLRACELCRNEIAVAAGGQVATVCAQRRIAELGAATAPTRVCGLRADGARDLQLLKLRLVRPLAEFPHPHSSRPPHDIGWRPTESWRACCCCARAPTRRAPRAIRRA